MDVRAASFGRSDSGVSLILKLIHRPSLYKIDGNNASICCNKHELPAQRTESLVQVLQTQSLYFYSPDSYIRSVSYSYGSMLTLSGSSVSFTVRIICHRTHGFRLTIASEHPGYITANIVDACRAYMQRCCRLPIHERNVIRLEDNWWNMPMWRRREH
jgi:hypothetical protein